MILGVLRAARRRRAAGRIARSIGVAFLALMGAVAAGLASTVSSAVQLLATTALVMTGTFTPTPDQAYLDMARNQYVVPALGDNYGPYVPVTTPEQGFPITGLFDYTFDTSVQIGLQKLEQAMVDNGFPREPLLIFGFSQSSVIWNIEKRKLAEYYAQHPELEPPDVTFVCIGCLNLPSTGIMSLYSGAYIPVIDFSFNGPALTDTPFRTVMITNQYDGFANSPRYPLLPLSTLNGLLGMLYAHGSAYKDLSLAPDPDKYLQGTFGDTTYYFFPNPNLPLFGPLRSLGVPEGLIDIFEPLVKVVVDWGYDQSTPPWVPTRVGLVPNINPVTAVGDLLRATQEGISNAAAFFETPPPVVDPAPVSAAVAGTPEAAGLPHSDATPPLDGAVETPDPVTSTRAAIEPVAGLEVAISATEPVAGKEPAAPGEPKAVETATSSTGPDMALDQPRETVATDDSVAQQLRPQLGGRRAGHLLHRGHADAPTAGTGDESGSAAASAASSSAGGTGGESAGGTGGESAGGTGGE